MVGKLWYLKKFDLFSRLEHEEVEVLAEQTKMDTIDEGQTIYFPGEPADTVYILKKGRVRISRSTEEGKKITLALLEPGEIFGELALTDESDRSTIAEAAENSLICSLSDSKFQDYLSDHPELNFDISRLIGSRRRQIESKIENLIFKDASGRLAYVLKDLFENHASSEENTEPPTSVYPAINLSHEEIADLSGLTRPTTTKLLNEFEDEDIIELNRRDIHLKKSRKLTKKIDA